MYCVEAEPETDRPTEVRNTARRQPDPEIGRALSDADWTEDGIEPGSAALLKSIFEQWNVDLRNAFT